MGFKYVIAIVRPEAVSSLESRLAKARVGGVTLTRVKGFGGYKNFFTDDWLSDHVKAEILVEQDKLAEVLDAVRQAGGSTLHGSGIVAVLPVDSLVGLRLDASSDTDRPGHRADPAPARHAAADGQGRSPSC